MSEITKTGDQADAPAVQLVADDTGIYFAVNGKRTDALGWSVPVVEPELTRVATLCALLDVAPHDLLAECMRRGIEIIEQEQAAGEHLDS